MPWESNFQHVHRPRSIQGSFKWQGHSANAGVSTARLCGHLLTLCTTENMTVAACCVALTRSLAERSDILQEHMGSTWGLSMDVGVFQLVFKTIVPKIKVDHQCVM